MSNLAVKKDVVDQVSSRVKQFQESGELHFPLNYSPENALKSAWLILQNTKTGKENGYAPVLQVCTKESIANALLDMVVQGLNPMKKQGYFIAYKNQLVFQRSYFGTMAVTKRVTGAKEINANVIYDGDDVEYELVNGKITNLVHKQSFKNIDKEKVIGSYCTIVMPDGNAFTEIMTIDELRKAWSKAQFWGQNQEIEKSGSTHDEFKGEMAKKSVINRACKKFLNASDDGSLVMSHVQGNEEELEMQTKLEEANSEVLDIEYEPVTDIEPEPTVIEPEPTETPAEAELDF